MPISLIVIDNPQGPRSAMHSKLMTENNSIPSIRLCDLPTDGSFRPGTPWILILEAGEWLTAGAAQQLIKYCGQNDPQPTRMTVERRLPKETMTKFAWVTTRCYLNKPPSALQKFISLETRLFPSDMMPCLNLQTATAVSSLPDFIESSVHEKKETPICPVLISHGERSETSNRITCPPDQEIFHYGHQKYFDDRFFSSGFDWPHTTYRTVRYDHIPSILEALRQGLSTPDIIRFTLAYLLQFRHFAKAAEVVTLIPELWYHRNPDLADVTAIVYFATGNLDMAFSLYSRILKSFPDSEEIAQNAIKICILASRYEAIDEIIHQYREHTGKDLTSSYYNRFTEIHGKAPIRTATLSVCMITRDEENTLMRAIASVKPFADEIIVVDTGSMDHSREIATTLGATVYDFPWTDDFSAARNFAISQATCDYIFMLDGDEYISPFFYIHSQTLKKILPLDGSRRAYSLKIGFYFNESDWLNVASEEGNFKVETNSVRVFPRLPHLVFSGRVAESIEPALLDQQILIEDIPGASFQIVHDRQEKAERIHRKLPIYELIEDPDELVIRAAIRDFSSISRTQDTIKWLHVFYNRQADISKKIQVGLQLAKVVSASNLKLAEELYRDLLQTCPGNANVFTAYATFLIVNNRINEMAHLGLSDQLADITDRLTTNCLCSLQRFEMGDEQGAVDILTDVLNTDETALLPQVVLFYFQASVNNVEGVVSSLDTLFTLIESRKTFNIERVEDVFVIAEELYSAIEKTRHRCEASLILHGITKLGMNWGVL